MAAYVYVHSSALVDQTQETQLSRFANLQFICCEMWHIQITLAQQTIMKLKHPLTFGFQFSALMIQILIFTPTFLTEAFFFIISPTVCKLCLTGVSRCFIAAKKTSVFEKTSDKSLTVLFSGEEVFFYSANCVHSVEQSGNTESIPTSLL